MSSVTSRIRTYAQPKGGLLPLHLFECQHYEDQFVINDTENIHASLVGLSVDYLTRYMQTGNREEAFSVSLYGASNVHKLPYAYKLLDSITGVDDLSISNACKLVSFDTYYRSGKRSYQGVSHIAPDADTIHNIRVMVERNLLFFDAYGPIILNGFTMDGGYTSTIDAGDGDILTADGLWDIKTNKSKPTSKHTLQILVYYLMGLHSVHSEFQQVQYLGLFNPRLNVSYMLPVSALDPSIIHEVNQTVIGYYHQSAQPVRKKPTKCSTYKNVRKQTNIIMSLIMLVFLTLLILHFFRLIP